MARAARLLGVDQTTVGRRISSLERCLRVALFIRSAAGFQLTAIGAKILEAAERMQEAAHELASEAVDGDAVGTTVVRVTTTDWLGQVFVVPALRLVQEKHAGVRIALVIDWNRADLRQGEADVAVRAVRPSDPRMACRKLADLTLRLYASREYLARHGVPETLRGHFLIAHEEALRSAPRLPLFHVPIEGARIAVETNTGAALLDAALAGLGVAQLPSYIAARAPQLVRVLPDYEEQYSAWLVVPQVKRRLAAVRAVCEAIIESFRSESSHRTTGVTGTAW